MLRKKNIISFLTIGILPFIGFAQTTTDLPPNWYNLDYAQDSVMGISTEKAYDLLKGRKATPIIVGVLDGGVDYKHEDLKDIMWINPKEIPNNGKDDDGNGYTDDMHGWNFLGNAQGENVNEDNLEVTRLIRKLESKYASLLPSSPMNPAERRTFVLYQRIADDYNTKLDEAQFGQVNYVRIKIELDTLIKGIGKTPAAITIADLDAITDKSDRQKMALRLAKQEMANGSFEKFYLDIEGATNYFTKQTEYHLNKKFEARTLIGDQYDNVSEKNYGNPDVKGPDAEHGTHVAGIIAANRTNGLGINGVAANVSILAVRNVPNGDERDKDVANAIRYAVDNGAKIINMSFGKGYTTQKQAVDQAIKYAEEKDVLLIHAAGNDNKNIDFEPNFPTKYYTDSLENIIGEAANWITVGATSAKLDEELLADFSNYGYKSVDVFAPGVKINSTTPESTYKEQNGTSMASPVVAGLAAMLRSYYPELTAIEVKDIIMKSVVKVDLKVNLKTEGGTKKVYLDEISVAGGIVNAVKAVEEANKFIAEKK